MACLSIGVLGPLRVTLDGAPVEGFEYTKVRALLAYLALAGRPQPRAHLAALLWPELPEKAARRNLTQALAALRRALDPAAPGVVQADGEAVALDPAQLEVDVARFTALLEASDRHPHPGWHTCGECAGRLTEALALYAGEFLSQLFVADSAPFEEWALVWREQYRQRALSALERLAQRAEWRGDFGAAIAAVRRQVEIDPLNEASQRELLRLLAVDGQRAAAEAQYEQLRRLLAAEFGAEPEAATRQVRDKLRAGPPEALRRWAAPPYGGPPAPNALVGRAEAVAAVVARLSAPGTRALTLTGPAGIGKTRLALAAAQALRFEYAEGVQVVELASAAEPGLVAAAIAQALGVKERPGQPLAAALAAWLRARHVLLVLDNFEHVLEAAPLVAELVAAAPRVTALITSRAPLRLQAEQQFPVAPLAQVDAVQLFTARVQAARPDFTLNAENAEAVAALCAQLDHVPLALELIAVRARSFSVAELRAQLAQPLEALDDGPRDLPDRQRTLRNALRWTYDRLSPGEQRAFAHLGVFAGGATAEAAQAVAGDDPPLRPALHALVEASLVQAQPGSETRFTLLEFVREFAREQLAQAGAAAAAHHAHAAYFAQLAEAARPALTGPDQARWFERLDRELPNLRAALRWSLDQAPALGLRLAPALEDYWATRGHIAEARRWLADLLARAPAAPPLLAEALLSAGWLASRQGDAAAAREAGERSRALFLRLEDARGLSLSGNVLGEAANLQSNFPEARRWFEASLALAREAGAPYAEAGALKGLAEAAMRLGDYAATRGYIEQRLAIYQAHHDTRNATGMLYNLGVIAYEQGDYATAAAYGESTLAAQRAAGDQYGLTLGLLQMGNVRSAQGDYAAAQTYLEEAVAIHRRQLNREPLAAPLNVLAKVLLNRGDPSAALPLARESLALRAEAGDRRGLSVTLKTLAQIAQALRRPERAARLLGASDALREQIRAPLAANNRAEHEQFIADLQAALGEAAYAAAFEAGHALTQEEAVAEAGA